MTEELENALRRTLEDAAERAPKAPAGIRTAPRTHRARRTPSRAVLVSAAVVVAIAGTTVGVRACWTARRTACRSGTRRRPRHRPCAR